MYGDLEIYIFLCPPEKSYLVRRQWVDVKFNVMGMQRIHVYTADSNISIDDKTNEKKKSSARRQAN